MPDDPRYEEVIFAKILEYPGCEFLEIGTRTGRFSIPCAQHIKKVNGHVDTVDFGGDFVVDPTKTVTFNMKSERQYIAQTRIRKEKLWDHITTYYCGANAFFKRNLRKYDVIFIDGDHCYEQGGRDLENATKALRKGGIIFMHDIKEMTQNLPVNKNVKRAFLEFDKVGFTKRMHEDIFDMGIIQCVR